MDGITYHHGLRRVETCLLQIGQPDLHLTFGIDIAQSQQAVKIRRHTAFFHLAGQRCDRACRQNLLWETLPQQMVMDVFTRPITVGDMVDNVCTQMNDFYQLKKRTILAVDDSGIILRKIKALLEDTYQVVLANSGAMAIKYLTLNTPDLILLDYAMPIVDGSQIMQMLREDPEFHHIPIIFLTGKNDAETVKNVMSLKPDGYLLKSMNPQKLHAAIDDFFASRGK